MRFMPGIERADWRAGLGAGKSLVGLQRYAGSGDAKESTGDDGQEGST